MSLSFDAVQFLRLGIYAMGAMAMAMISNPVTCG